MRNWWIHFVRDDRGQDAFEYLLVAGTVVIVLVLALFAFEQLIPEFVGSACSSVDTSAANPEDCVNP